MGVESNGVICGVVQVGRPVSRVLDDGKTLEVVRLCTDGTKNACSFLYSRAARIAKELGYSKIITYILETESGDSLAASGWLLEDAKCGGGNWSCKSRPRNTTAPQCFKQRWSKMLNWEVMFIPRSNGNTYDLSGEYGIGYTSNGEQFYFDK